MKKKKKKKKNLHLIGTLADLVFCFRCYARAALSITYVNLQISSFECT